jgi:hypothetical protein
MAHFSVRFKAFDRDCILRARKQLQSALSLCQPSKTPQPALAEQEPDTSQEKSATLGSERPPHHIAELLGPNPKVIDACSTPRTFFRFAIAPWCESYNVLPETRAHQGCINRAHSHSNTVGHRPPANHKDQIYRSEWAPRPQEVQRTVRDHQEASSAGVRTRPGVCRALL